MSLRKPHGALIGISLFLASSAWAGGNDFRLNAKVGDEGIFFASEAGDTFVPRPEAWTAFIDELSFVLAPRISSPAETLGHSGFGVGLLWSGTSISSDQNYWKSTSSAQSSGQARGMIHTLQLDVRKGLPLSFEIGLDLVWLADSQMFAPGVEVRWAPIEGYRYLPDFALRGAANHLVGARDVNLTVIGVDAVISKGFGLAGFVHVAPYFSVSMLMSAATPRVIDPTPLNEGDLGKNLVLPSISVGDSSKLRLTLGSRFLFSLLTVTLQGELALLEQKPLVTISSKLGLDF